MLVIAACMPLSTLVTRPSAATTSVKVPPVSAPTRIAPNLAALRDHAEMARFWFRRRRPRSSDEPQPADSDATRLDGVEHAWWAQRDVDEVWTPREKRPNAPEEGPGRDILADHFGEDWRTSFGFTTAPDDTAAAAEPPAELPPFDESDPYSVLEVDPSATWDEIVSAHRHQARVHHPDRLFGLSPEELAEGEDRIRIINGAYQELRVRRGR